MRDVSVILAERRGLGRVWFCKCGAIHLTVGPVTVNLDAASYMCLVEMVNTSAANFEMLMQARTGGATSLEEDGEDHRQAN